MLKNILKLDGAQQLSKNEQKSINGGLVQRCRTNSDCTGTPPPGAIYVCASDKTCKLELLP